MAAPHYVNNVAAQGVQFQRPLCPYPERGTSIGVRVWRRASAASSTGTTATRATAGRKPPTRITMTITAMVMIMMTTVMDTMTMASATTN